VTGSCRPPAGMRHSPPMSVETVTLKIPKPLYLRLQKLIEHTGFRSPTEFVLFVLRDLAGAETEDLEQVRDRLKKLGYL
jgi:hypothetical protein